jgi:NTF2-related export protein 1/2
MSSGVGHVMAEFADIADITKKALQAQKIYYEHLDESPEKRAQLRSMYLPNANHTLMNWNGYALDSVEAIAGYHENLPKTKHVVKCLDAQPLPGNDGGDSFFVTVTGSATYDDEHVRHFFQRLVFAMIDRRLYIVQDYMRWTGEG